jgi:hypothetical protein
MIINKMVMYLIEYNNKIIGTYNNYYTAKTFVLSCLQNNFMIDFALIHYFRNNSCYKTKTTVITLNKNRSINELDIPVKIPVDISVDIPVDIPVEIPVNIPVEIITITPEMKLENEKRINEIEKEKHNLIHNMNLLKIQQNKITEIKQVFEVDLKLFNQFKLAKEVDEKFVIPELFVNKYKIMNNLFLKDKLDCENYYNDMKINNKDNMYDEHFIVNSYENSFINNKKLDKTNKIDEELYLDI